MQNITIFLKGFLRWSFILLLLFNTSCEQNLAPIIESIVLNQTELEAGESINLSVSVQDPDGDVLIYLWESDGGLITTENNLMGITWQAPMEKGNYSVRVSVNDGTDIVADSVQIAVISNPVMVLDKESILFDGSKTQDFFSISNSGNGLLNWNIQYSTTDGGDWIKSVLPEEGSTPSDQPANVEVNVDRTGLAGGRYFGSVNISSDDKNASVQLVLEVAQLIVNPTQLNFGSSTTNKDISIVNSGAGNIDFSLSVSDSWITVNPNSGQTGSQPSLIDVEVDRTGMNTGTYNGQITVSSELGDVNVGINMEVKNDPLLFVNTATLDFGTEVNSRSFFIQNRGGESLTWTISEGLNWLTVNPTSGSTTTETDNIQVLADRSKLVGGAGKGKINVSSNGGNFEIDVSIEKDQTPVLQVSETEMDFGTSNTSMKFTIRNTGDGSLTWNISESLSWLSVTPQNGSTTTEIDELVVDVDRSGLFNGKHSGTITINSNGGDQSIKVNIEKANQPVLQVSSRDLDFSTSVNSLSFSITNTGGQSLNWSISENLNWIQVIPRSGNTTTETDNIQVIADRSVLELGGHTGQITINSNGGDVVINVAIRIDAEEKYLIHDDDSFEGFTNTDASRNIHYRLVQFDRPSDWNEFKITRIEIMFKADQSVPIKVVAYNTQSYQFEGQTKYGPYQFLFSEDGNTSEGLTKFDVENWELDMDYFCVGYYSSSSDKHDLYYDSSNPKLRSYHLYRDADNNLASAIITDINWGIRVYVEKINGPIEPGRWLNMSEKPLGNPVIEVLNK